jgi:hypothetical protein
MLWDWAVKQQSNPKTLTENFDGDSSRITENVLNTHQLEKLDD